MNINGYKCKYMNIKYINKKVWKKELILLYPILLGGGTNIGPYWFPSPILIPSVAQIPCQEAERVDTTIL